MGETFEEPLEESEGPVTAEAPLPIEAGRRERPVLVTGAAGLVGSHLCRELSRRGWPVRALVRDPVKAASRLAEGNVQLLVGDVRDAEALREAADGAGAVVHLAAVAIEQGGATYEAVNTEATRTVLEAARQARVSRFVFVSQNGASPDSPYRFLRSKGEAERLVTSSDLPWTVFRPSVIFGPEDAFANSIARLARLTPLVLPIPGDGRARFQPVAAGDVARAIAIALENDAALHRTYALGGPAPLTLREMAERILLAMHLRRVIVPLPLALMRPLVLVLERLLPRPPVTRSLLELLAVDNVVHDDALRGEFGIVPTPFAPEELLYLRALTVRDALRALLRGK